MPDHIPACAYLVHGGNIFPQAFSVVDKQRAEDQRLRRNDNSMVTPLVPRHAMLMLVEALQSLSAKSQDDIQAFTADVIARANYECAKAAMGIEAQAYAQAIAQAAR